MLRFFMIFSLIVFSGISVSASAKDELMKDIIRSIQNKDLLTLKGLLVETSVNIKDSKTLKTPLHYAVISENIKAVEWLLKNKAIVDAQTRSQRTPLHLASFKLNYDIVKLLLKYKAQVDLSDNRGFTALHYTSQRNTLRPNTNAREVLKIAKLLLKKSKRLLTTKDKLGETPLHVASFSGYERLVKLFLKEDSSLVGLQNKNNQTALHQSIFGWIQFQNIKNIKKSYQKIVRNLSQYKSILNTPDSDGRTALHHTAEKGLDEMAQSLLAAGSNTNSQDRNGWTPLFLASANAYVPLMQNLIKNGANINIKDNKGMAALYFAVGSGEKKAVALLLQSKARVFFKDSNTGKALFDEETTRKLKDLFHQFYEKKNKKYLKIKNLMTSVHIEK